MEKWLQAKKQHHYVWEHYLKQWATDGKVYWITPKRKIGYDSPKGMCREGGLYKIAPLDKNDIEFIKAHIRPLHKNLQDVHIKTLNTFIEASEIFLTYTRMETQGHDLTVGKNSLLFNLLENMYCEVESGAKQAIEGLAADTPGILEDSKNLIFLYSYIGHQITRTLGLKKKCFQVFNQSNSLSADQLFYNNLTEKNWWFTSWILGYNAGFSLYDCRKIEPMTILKNSTDTPFITSDSPVINIYHYDDESTPPEIMDVYFPISPKRALVIRASDSWKFLEENINRNNVEILNTIIAKKACFSIYGLTKESIEPYKNTITFI